MTVRSLKLLGEAGCRGLTAEEELILNNEMVLLSAENPRLENIKVLAKITGYFGQFGASAGTRNSDDNEEDKKSNDEAHKIFYVVSAEDLSQANKLTYAYFYSSTDDYKLKNLYKNDEKSETIVKNEIKALQKFVLDFEEFSNIIPKNSYTLNENSHLICNEYYGGLDHNEAVDLSYYRRLRPYDLELKLERISRVGIL